MAAFCGDLVDSAILLQAATSGSAVLLRLRIAVTAALALTAKARESASPAPAILAISSLTACCNFPCTKN